MWKLVCENTTNLVHCLTTEKEYSIGRRDCDIIIPNDMSISRKHATIKVIHPEGNLAFPERRAILHFKDLSKLGTQLKDGRIANGQERNLQDGDQLIFGTAGISKYRVRIDPVIVTTSCLSQSSKKEVRRNILKLGGHLVNEWCNECQVVVMNNLSVTIKVISALLSLKLIVTPQFFEDILKAVEGSTKLPDASDYLPNLSESQVSSTDVSFSPNAKRQTLFLGKTFIFLSPSQYAKLHQSLELGGAKTKLITNADEIEALVSAENSCVMIPDVAGSQASASWIRNVQTVLSRLKRRMIAESEIGFAVLYCSTKTHCNATVELSVPSYGLPPQSVSQNMAPMNSDIPKQTSVSQLHSTEKTRNPVSDGSGQNCSFITPLLPMKVKEEPLSQPIPEQQIVQNKKRAREKSDDKDSVASMVAPILEEEESAPKKCCLETDTGISNNAARTSARFTSAVGQIADVEDFANSSSNKRLNPDRNVKASEALGVNFAGQLEPNVCKVTKGDDMEKTKLSPYKDGKSSNGCQAVAAESLEMDFSIGTCVEPSSATAKVKMEIDAVPSIYQGTEHANSDGVAKRNCQSSVYSVQQKISAAQTEKPLTKPERKDCKSGLPLLQAVESSKTNIHIQPGYMTAILPIHMVADPDFVKVEELPCNVVVTEVKSLVFRKPSCPQSKAVGGGGSDMWNGRMVKNFKKFKKVCSLTSNRLPRIIGGRDLVVHESIPAAMQEDWFRNELQDQSQQQNSELLSQEFASWQPLYKRR